MPEELSVDDPQQRATLPKGVEVFRFSGPMFFGVAGEMMDALRRSGRTPTAIILRMDSVPYIDSSGAAALESFAHRAYSNGTRVIVCELREQPRLLLTKLWRQHAEVTLLPTFQAALGQVATDRA